MSVYLVVEGDTDLPVARKLAEDARLPVLGAIDCGGKDRLDASLAGFNDAAKGHPWLVLRDLDDIECAPTLLRSWQFRRARWMCLRVAVRETESWLMADADALARFLDIDGAAVPARPDEVDDPTRALVQLAQRSRSARMRVDMVPAPGHSASVGPLYEQRIIEFGTSSWNLSRACKRSASLARARKALRRLAGEWRRFATGRR